MLCWLVISASGGRFVALLGPTFELQRWQKLPRVRLKLKLSKFLGDTMINWEGQLCPVLLETWQPEEYFSQNNSSSFFKVIWILRGGKSFYSGKTQVKMLWKSEYVDEVDHLSNQRLCPSYSLYFIFAAVTFWLIHPTFTHHHQARPPGLGVKFKSEENNTLPAETREEGTWVHCSRIFSVIMNRIDSLISS